MSKPTPLTAIELCAGAGGQALGLELAGFHHKALVEIDPHCCQTLRMNRPSWDIHEEDLRKFSGKPFAGEVDLLAGGLPCPPFSVAGKQLGDADERNLFPEAIRLVREIRPRAVMIENVRGILDAVFEDYRKYIADQMKRLGYRSGWRLLNASDFGVPQLRPRVVFLGLHKDVPGDLPFPTPLRTPPPTVADTIGDLMHSRKWSGFREWKKKAQEVAPTIVGGSKKHGGPDLGPTRAKRAWEALGVDGRGIANDPPEKDFAGMPRLTVRMVARIQGFPNEWQFAGGKTAAYRQVGNAFPPPVAQAVARGLYDVLSFARTRRLKVA
jgi:DNA (cytosine-5)-methyltransferase 1